MPQLFRNNRIIVYALPSKTSGKTQPCDVTLFGSYKRELYELVPVVADIHDAFPLATYDFAKLVT